MTDNTFNPDGDELLEQTNGDVDMGGMDFDANGEDDDFMNDITAVDNICTHSTSRLPVDTQQLDDDDFRLEGFDDLGANDDALDTGNQDSPTNKKRKLTPSTKVSVTKKKEAEPLILEDEESDLPGKQSLRVAGTFGRPIDRPKGSTLPAYHRPVTHELDSDDELIMGMRDKGFSDRQIADKLVKDGRTRYDPKSISTRITRIRLAQATNVDFLLKEGYKEWNQHEDCLLVQAYALADIEMSYEIERIRTWRFRKVSEYMRRLNKDALFSEKACRERYTALMNGSAVIPSNLDDDPTKRRAEMEAWRVCREAIRKKDKIANELKELEERQSKDEKASTGAAKADEVARKRAQAAMEKSQRAALRAVAAQLRAERAAENLTTKAQRHAQVEKQKQLNKKKIDETKTTSPTAGTPTRKATLGAQDTSVNDPRRHLSLQDLSSMCTDRGVEANGEDKDQLLAGLRDADEEWTVDDMKKMLRLKSLPFTGTKAVLRYRLALAAAKTCSSYSLGAVQDEDED